jgi:hypothetical protein
MKHALGLMSVTFLCLSSLGCSGEETTQGGSGGSSGGTGGATGGTGGATGGTGATTGGTGGSNACGTMITANAVNNYSFSSTLTFPPIMVQPNAELTFDWSAVTTDFQEHDLNPMTDIDAVHLMLWKFTQEQLETEINADTVQQRDLAIQANFYTEKMATTAGVFAFTSLGMPLERCQIWPFLQAPSPDIATLHPECDDPATPEENEWATNVADGFDPATHTYTVVVSTGTMLGRGTRMIQAFKLDPSSTNTMVAVTPTSTELDYTVDLEALTPTPMPAGNPNITIEWGGMTVNAHGHEFIPLDITEVRVAHYAETVSELEARFLDLDMLATDTWTGEVLAGTNVSLSGVMNTRAGGPAFTGIDNNGTWIIALTCGRCRNPAPWYLSVVTPCTP